MFRRLKFKISPGSLLGVIALFVALGGVAYAGSVINGNSIQNNSIPGKKLRNGAVTNVKVKANSLRANRLTAGARAQFSTPGPPGPRGLQGPAGPHGAQGPHGPQGPAGTALAYAEVNAGPVGGNPSFVAARTSGFTAVERTAGGRYCLTPSSTVLAQAFSGGQATRPAVVSVDFDNTATPGDPLVQVLVRGTNVDCGANRFEVLTYYDGSPDPPASEISFTLIVP